MLSCREFVAGTDALLARELGWRARLAMRLHMFLCADCRRYLRQFGLMLRALQRSDPGATPQSIEATVRRLESQSTDPL